MAYNLENIQTGSYSWWYLPLPEDERSGFLIMPHLDEASYQKAQDHNIHQMKQSLLGRPLKQTVILGHCLSEFGFGTRQCGLTGQDAVCCQYGIVYCENRAHDERSLPRPPQMKE